MQSVDEVQDAYLNKKYDIAEAQLSAIQEDIDFVIEPKGLQDYIRYINALRGCRPKVSKVKLECNILDIKKMVEAQYDSLIDAHTAKEVAVNEKYEKLINDHVAVMGADVRSRNEQRKQRFVEANNIYIELEEKRKKLEEYNDSLVDMCNIYGITTADIQLDNSSFTLKELDTLYDEYLDYMQAKGNKKNIVKKFRSKVPNCAVQGALLLCIFFIAFTTILDFVAIAFFIYVYKKQCSIKKQEEMHIILLGLVYNIHPLEMGFRSALDDSELEQDKNVEEDEEVKQLVDAWEKELCKLDGEDPVTQLEEMKLQFVNATSEIQEEIQALTESIEAQKEDLIGLIDDKVSRAEMEFDRLRSEVKMLGDSINPMPIFNTVFKLGCSGGVFEETVNIGLRNIIIHPTGDARQMKMFLQVLLANALCNVRANSITVTIYDPNGSGIELASFYSDNIKQLIKYKRDNLTETLADMRAYVSKNMLEMGGNDINAFNTKAVASGRTPRDYMLLMVLSQPKEVDEDEALSAFMAYSAKFGGFIWLVSEKTLPDIKVFSKPFEGVQHPYVVNTEEFGSKISKLLEYEVKHLETEALLWKDFIKVDVQADKVWTYITDNEIELDPGFIDGDPTQYRGYTVGNQGNIHMLGVGGTGAGKSVLLNHLIATLCYKYSPRTLELWLVDFKGVEFSFYLGNEKFPSILPHIKACLCTSDADYAESLFNALEVEARRRYEILRETGYKDMYKYNEAKRREGKENEVFRRIIFICDEFQVVFEKAIGNILLNINKSITYVAKVARAAGIHFAFFSQSTNKTISADILQQFTLRFALRCDEAVSMAVLGTKFASEIKQVNGYLYVRSVGDADLQSQKRYRTPYITDDVLHEHIALLANMAEEQGITKHDVITYQESTVHELREVDGVYSEVEANQKVVVADGLMVLGERMTYSSINRAPKNVILSNKNNTHIFSAFANYEDYINFYKTIMCNISHSKYSPIIFWNCQVADMHYLCELDKDVPEELMDMSRETFSIYDTFEICKELYKSKKEAGDNKTPAYFILLCWDKAIGFGIDKDPNFSAEVASLLQTCAEYNIHFIFICNDIGSIGNNVISACKYRIAGKVSEKASPAIIGTMQACKESELPNGYMYIAEGKKVERAKIYHSVQEREIKPDELVL